MNEDFYTKYNLLSYYLPFKNVLLRILEQKHSVMSERNSEKSNEHDLSFAPDAVDQPRHVWVQVLLLLTNTGGTVSTSTCQNPHIVACTKCSAFVLLLENMSSAAFIHWVVQ